MTGSDGAAHAMSPAEVRWRLLVSAAEDYTPLFQALWEFGVPEHPRPGAPTADEVKFHLWQLIEAGLVELFHGVDDAGDFIPVLAEERTRVYLAPASWEVVENPATDVRYSTTPAGDEAVARRPDDVAEPDWGPASSS
ncbi:MAG TPA: hypothetical protein VFW27_33090 [Actinoplanes sp.]|nr:hypothetical protein [Actinoplanes sp.]